MTERAPQLPALTGLRFVAALTIVLYHYARLAWSAPTASASGPGALALRVLHNIVIGTGAGGVDLFFVLSGFVMAYAYITPGGTVRATPRAFWLARVARLYPAYLLAWALAFVPLLLARSPGAPAAGLLSLLWLQAWVAPLAFVGNGPAYTISIEALFYLVFPFLAAPLARCAQRAPRRTLLVLYGALWLAPLVASLAPDGSLLRAAIGISPLARLPAFLVGVVVGVRFVRARARGAAPRQAPALAAVALILWLGLCGLGPLVGPWGVIGPLTGTLVPTFGLLVWALAWGHGPLAWLLARPWLVRLGEASYALYILQQPAWDLLQRAARLPFAAAMHDARYVACYVALLVVLALLVLRSVETPARRGLRRLGARA